MQLKAIVDKQEFFNRLIKSKCNFKKICGLYPAKCRDIKYIGQLRNFKEMEVYQLSEEEAKLFKILFKLFKESKIIIKEDQ